jgi:hypothetical protein
MSIYYSPNSSSSSMEERLREARQSNIVHCCEDLAARTTSGPNSSIHHLASASAPVPRRVPAC